MSLRSLGGHINVVVFSDLGKDGLSLLTYLKNLPGENLSRVGSSRGGDQLLQDAHAPHRNARETRDNMPCRRSTIAPDCRRIVPALSPAKPPYRG